MLELIRSLGGAGWETERSDEKVMGVRGWIPEEGEEVEGEGEGEAVDQWAFEEAARGAAGELAAMPTCS